MANYTQNNQYAKNPRPIRKLRFGSLFVDAPVREEPQEAQKIVVAGLAEAQPVKDYPDTPFKRAFAVMKGEFATLFKTGLFALLFTLPFIVILAWFSGYFETMQLGGVYNFMSGIGVGYNPGAVDSINESVASLYWDVKAPIACMLVACMIFGALGLGGQFYCAKRSYYQNYYKKTVKTYWMGFAKHWWKYLICATFAALIGAGLAVSMLYLLQQQTLGTAGAGAYCAVVFSWLIGVPLLSLPMVTMSIVASYELSFLQAIKNAIVIIANAPLMVIIVGVLSAVPVLLLLTNSLFAIIIYIVMVLVGTNFLALCWIGLGEYGMRKCHYRKEDNAKKELHEQRQAQKRAQKEGKATNPYANGAVQASSGAKKKKQAPKPYQNPKKKKKN